MERGGRLVWASFLLWQSCHAFVSPTFSTSQRSLGALKALSTREETSIASTSIADMTTLPRHTHDAVNQVLKGTEEALQEIHGMTEKFSTEEISSMDDLLNSGESHEKVFANSYVDLGKVDIVGFDYDYTLVTYKEELLELIYEIALKKLVEDRQYPTEMLDAGLRFDPRFSIRGLAVDRENGWICHLSYTHKVAVAWEGREKVPKERIFREYRAKRALRPLERKQRIKPLNDLFSMAECCLIADTVQFFKDNDIPFCPQNAVNDILKAIGDTHMSGNMHRMVSQDPGKYFHPTPHLHQVLNNLREANKRLILVSNSPFWYVNAGMSYVIGPDWRESWDAVITTAGKPNFYTDSKRPFRQVCKNTGRIFFDQVKKLEKDKVYTEGCLKELIRLMDWGPVEEGDNILGVGGNVLYIGDSLFADLVDAKREYGWTTAAVTPEVGYELELQKNADYIMAQNTIDILLNALRVLQDKLGPGERTEEDYYVLDSLERLVSKWRDRETQLLGNPFGSVFRARFQPSLFAHSLRRYCDLYMSSVSSLRNYSAQHRFYPADSRLLSHEIKGPLDENCWDLGEVLESDGGL